MTRADDLSKKALIDLLNRCWMTHDAMWFHHCLLEFGIETANRLNKAAIKALAPIEIGRMKRVLGFEKDPIETLRDFRRFFQEASNLFIPDFMNASMTFPKEDVLHWRFKPGECFAYKGMKKMGAIDGYECGVIYRVGCWLHNLGIGYGCKPEIKGCLMLEHGNCEGEFSLRLS